MDRVVALLILLLLLTLAGCTDPAASEAEAGPRPLRIASLSPALSRTLVDLGLETRIVGRSRFCEFLDPAIPVVGDLLRVEYERLVDVEPTHVLVQAAADGVDPALATLAEERGWTLLAWSTLDGIADIERVVRELPALLHPTPGPDRDTLTRQAERLQEAITAALAPDDDVATWRGSTLLVYNLEPVGVFGRGTYLDEVLTRLGGTNALTVSGWKNLSLEDVTRIDPGAIVLVRAGTVSGADPLEEAGLLAGLDVAAVRDRRIAVLAHPDALRPCTGIIGVARRMRDTLRTLAHGTSS